MTNNWIQHIKDFASKNNLSFGCALSNPECLKSYRQKKEPKKNPINKEIEAKQIEAKKNEAELEAQSIYKEYMSGIQGGMIIKNMTNKSRFNPVLNMHLRLNRTEYKKLTGKDLPSVESVVKQFKKEEKQYEKAEKIREQKALEQKLKEPINKVDEFDWSFVKKKKKAGIIF